MNDNLFVGGEDKTPAIDPNKDYLAELVGEGKKFKDAQALAYAKAEADFTIDMFKQRMDEMRADYKALHEAREAGATLQELVDQIKTQQKSESNFTPADDTNVTPKEVDFDKLVESKIEQRETARKEQDNLARVQQTLRERYGNDYQKVLAEQRDVHRLSDKEVNDLAKRSPEAFFRVMGINQQMNQDNTFQTPPRSVSRSDSFAPSVPKRTWKYYQDLKRTDANLYYSPKIFNQMLKDAEDLGDAFKDGDYKRFGDE